MRSKKTEFILTLASTCHILISLQKRIEIKKSFIDLLQKKWHVNELCSATGSKISQIP